MDNILSDLLVEDLNDLLEFVYKLRKDNNDYKTTHKFYEAIKAELKSRGYSDEYFKKFEV